MNHQVFELVYYLQIIFEDQRNLPYICNEGLQDDCFTRIACKKQLSNPFRMRSYFMQLPRPTLGYQALTQADFHTGDLY